MKKISFIIAINFLIYPGTAEMNFSRPLNTFLSYFGLGSNADYEEIPAVPDTDDTKTEYIYDPLELVFVSFDGKTLMGTIGNIMFLRQDIRNGEFVDVEYACPKKEDEKDANLAKTIGRDKVPEPHTLVIEKSYISFVDKYINEAEVSKEKNEDNANEAENGELGISNSSQEQQPNQDTDSNQEHAEKGDEPELTSMEYRKENFSVFSSPSEGEINPEELYSTSRQKIKGNDSLEHIPEQHETTLHVNRGDSLDETEENSSGENIMDEIGSVSTLNSNGNDIKETETDSASIQKTDAAPNKTGSDSASNQKSSTANLIKTSSLKSQAPIKPKIRRVAETFTHKNEPYWLKAIKDVENFKCKRPVRPILLLYPSSSAYTIYIAGFDVYLETHEDMFTEKFRKEPDRNRKLKFFWSFTVVFNNIDHSVCVYHEVQYNRDTFNPKINEDFDNHDLGKAEMFPNLDIIQVYKIENQEKVFRKLFKNNDERKKYFDVNEGRFLEELHLAPLHGFLSPVVRQSAKTYGNVAPMWKSIKNGAWGKLEDHVNTLSSVLKHLIVITGTYGTLKLNGKEVFLADDPTIPVPLAYWKMVIYEPDLDDFPGILIITSNNPYEDIGNVICEEDKCSRFGWGYVRETELTRGRTICCDFTPDILNKVPILKGAQPTQVLNLKKLLPLVEEIWEFDERGKRTTPKQLIKILERLKKSKNSTGKMIADEEKSREFVENEDAENENPNKIEETVPLSEKRLLEEGVYFPKRHVEI